MLIEEECWLQWFLAPFVGVVFHCGRIGCGVSVLPQAACLVVHPIAVGSFAFLFACASVGRVSDSAAVPALGLFC